MRFLLPFAVASTCAFTVGCETVGQNTLLGAGAGAAIAAATHNCPLAGAAIGAASGFVLGRALQYERARAYEEGYYSNRYGYPVGHFSDRHGLVISPYPPHNLIDVHGIPPGAKVLDPSCDRIFINP
jgi:hypothetical protein